MSGPRFLLDANICIFIRRKRPAALLSRFRQLRIGDACMSAITFGELRFGACKSDRRNQALAELDEFASLAPILPLPLEAANAYGSIRASLSSSGQMIGSNDLWIAAHAIATDMTLVTNDMREFQRVEGLRVVDWTVDN